MKMVEERKTKKDSSKEKRTGKQMDLGHLGTDWYRGVLLEENYEKFKKSIYIDGRFACLVGLF